MEISIKLTCKKKQNKVMIFDTSVIIELLHANILDKLNDYRNSTDHNIEFILTDVVFEELRKGKRVEKIESLLKQIFEIYETPTKIMNKISSRKLALGPGELSVLAIATLIKQRNPSLSITVIMDDKKGRKAAKELGLEVHGTLWIIIQLKKEKIISKEEAIRIVNELPYRGFHLDKEILDQIIKKINIDC